MRFDCINKQNKVEIIIIIILKAIRIVIKCKTPRRTFQIEWKKTNIQKEVFIYNLI